MRSLYLAVRSFPFPWRRCGLTTRPRCEEVKGAMAAAPDLRPSDTASQGRSSEPRLRIRGRHGLGCFSRHQVRLPAEGAAVNGGSNFSAYNISDENAGVRFLSNGHIFKNFNVFLLFRMRETIPSLQDLLHEKKKKSCGRVFN